MPSLHPLRPLHAFTLVPVTGSRLRLSLLSISSCLIALAAGCTSSDSKPTALPPTATQPDSQGRIEAQQVSSTQSSLQSDQPNTEGFKAKGLKAVGFNKGAKKPRHEIVMTPGMKITAITQVGRITITAIDNLTRSYTWEGATRSVEMYPRGERWYGSLGLYYPGPGDHWKPHNGISRAVVEEGQQHFKSIQEALKWIKERAWMPFVYRDDGLMVGWSKTLPRRQLNVEVWQILINGKKPQHLPGSRNQAITVSRQKPQSSNTSLIVAVQNNELAAVQLLLAKGADPNLRDSTGAPVLIVAANAGSAPIVKALLDKGANANATNADGSAALLLAAGKGHRDIVKLLLAKGANVNATEPRGMFQGSTALMLAAMRGQTSIIETLLSRGAKVNVANVQGDTAIKLAASGGHTKAVALLLKRGANVDSRDWLGTTPLMAAAMTGHVDMVKLLIKHKAKVNARVDETRRMYQQAAFVGDAAAQQQIIKSGKLKVRREDGASVLDYAKIGGNQQIIALLTKAGAR